MAASEITDLLVAWSRGDSSALDRLMPLVYRRLQKMAASFLRQERADHTLQATALVNEAYLRLVDQTRMRWQDRAHFFAMAGRMMRRILVDHARALKYQKRGGDAERVSSDVLDRLPAQDSQDLLALDDALRCLGEKEPLQAKIVELHYFGGLTQEEMVEVLGVSRSTITRRWRLARAWLYRTLVQEESEDF